MSLDKERLQQTAELAKLMREPRTVLGLIIERDQLKAENEALRKHAPSSEIIWCECGDGYPANSYGAGFMAANDGVCENCDAANACRSGEGSKTDKPPAQQGSACRSEQP